jgi:uncharacterized protein (TIGR02996 family)
VKPRVIPDVLPALKPFHPDEEGLLRTCLENPQDNAPRLILSDWYEERGLSDFADYIRYEVHRSFDQEAAPLPDQAKKWAKTHIPHFARLNNSYQGSGLQIQFTRGLPCRCVLYNDSPLAHRSILREHGPWLTDFLWYGGMESDHSWIHDDWVRQLRSLSFGRIRSAVYSLPNQSVFSDEFFRDLTQTTGILENLHTFALWGTQLTDRAAAPLLEDFPCEVQELEFSDNPLSLSWYVQLIRSPLVRSLRRLSISGAKLNDRVCRTMAHTPQLSQLKYLQLGWNRLTEHGVKFLLKSANLPNLEYIDIRYNRLTRLSRLQLSKQSINPRVYLKIV